MSLNLRGIKKKVKKRFKKRLKKRIRKKKKKRIRKKNKRRWPPLSLRSRLLILLNLIQYCATNLNQMTWQLCRMCKKTSRNSFR